MLNVKTKTDGNCLNVELKGKIDTTTAPELTKKLEAPVKNAESIVFDMKELKYISSAGLRIILSLHKEMSKKGGLVLKNVNENIMEIFDFTGFADILNIK